MIKNSLLRINPYRILFTTRNFCQANISETIKASESFEKKQVENL